MALTVLIVAAGAAFGGYLVRRGPSWRLAIAVLTSVAVLLPMGASSAASVSPHHHKNATTRPRSLMPERARGSFRPRAAGQRSLARSASRRPATSLRSTGTTVSCHHDVARAGSFSEKLWLAPNRGHFAETQAFELVASGKGTAKGEFFVRLAPAPVVMVTTTTVAPTTSATANAPVTSALPTGTVPVLPVGPFPVTPSGTTTTTAAPTATATTTTTVATTTTERPRRPTTTTTTTATTTPHDYDHDFWGIELRFGLVLRLTE